LTANTVLENENAKPTRAARRGEPGGERQAQRPEAQEQRTNDGGSHGHVDSGTGPHLASSQGAETQFEPDPE
jgi:hypothetical protein